MGNSGSCQKSKIKSSRAQAASCKLLCWRYMLASMVVSALASVSAYYVVFGDAR